LKLRVLTALALIPVVLGVVLCTSPWPFAIALLAVLILACLEGAALFGTSKPAAVFAGLFISVGLALLWHYEVRLLNGPAICVLGLIISVVGIAIAASKAPRWLSPLGAAWIAAPLFVLYLLHQGATFYQSLFMLKSPILLTLLPLWGGDTAAIFVGKAFGKHPLAPAISPKKTWEGSIANLVVCVLVAVPLSIWIGYGVVMGVLCGLAAGLFGQAGDLFQSSLKRKADVKDSGTLLPGHGGILDRIDSLLFTAPLVALILSM